MSFELAQALRRCGLETGARRRMLEALAEYTDEETGLATASQVTLAVHVGISERHARRILDGMISDARLEGLVALVHQPSGRGRAAIYRLHLERVEPLAASVKIAQRACYAGASKALMDSGLVGAVLSPANIRRAMARLKSLCEHEGQAAPAAAIAAQIALFEAVMAAAGKETQADHSGAFSGCGNPTGKADIMSGFSERNPDILSKNPDISSKVHSKDIYPSGNNSLTRETENQPAVENAAGDGRDGPSAERTQHGAEAAQAVQGFAVKPETIFGWLPPGRATQRAFLEDFRQRPVSLAPSGNVVIRVRSEREAGVLASRWLIALLNWANDHGIPDVVFATPAAGGSTGPPR